MITPYSPIYLLSSWSCRHIPTKTRWETQAVGQFSQILENHCAWREKRKLKLFKCIKYFTQVSQFVICKEVNSLYNNIKVHLVCSFRKVCLKAWWSAHVPHLVWHLISNATAHYCYYQWEWRPQIRLNLTCDDELSFKPIRKSLKGLNINELMKQLLLPKWSLPPSLSKVLIEGCEHLGIKGVVVSQFQHTVKHTQHSEQLTAHHSKQKSCWQSFWWR